MIAKSRTHLKPMKSNRLGATAFFKKKGRLFPLCGSVTRAPNSTNSQGAFSCVFMCVVRVYECEYVYVYRKTMPRNENQFLASQERNSAKMKGERSRGAGGLAMG